jgi:hypothetical protein
LTIVKVDALFNRSVELCLIMKESSMLSKRVVMATAAVALLSAAVAPARAEPAKNVVLVHGAFADGSGWKPVADILRQDGFTVSIVQEPETSLADDVTATNRILDRQPGPAVLVSRAWSMSPLSHRTRARSSARCWAASLPPRTASRQPRTAIC